MQANNPEVVVLTGASAGVGRATAREFGKHGAKVALLARNPEGLEGARTEVESVGGQALPITTDVADADAVQAAAERVEEEFGPIDVWVNDAMTTVFASFKDIEPEDYKRATEVTYLGAVYGTMSAMKRMLPRNKGTIVQVGSALAYRSIPLQSAYCGAKHAIRGFTDSVRVELMHEGSDLHITMVQLPAVNTPQFDQCKTELPRHPQPVPPIFQPEVPARAIYWAAHQRRREVYLGNSTLVAVFGNKIAPWFADWYLSRTGFESQQTDEPVKRDRPYNLYEPVSGDHGAHGSFDSKALESSLQFWAAKNRNWLVLAGVAGLAGTAIAALKK